MTIIYLTFWKAWNFWDKFNNGVNDFSKYYGWFFTSETESVTSSQGLFWDSLASAGQTAGEAQDVLEALKARKKLK